MAEIRLPLIINGKRKNGIGQCLDYERDKKIRFILPKITVKDLEKIEKAKKDNHDFSVEEIISFFSQVGELWKNNDYYYKKKAMKLAEITTGLHAKMIQHTYEYITKMLTRDYLKHMLNGEIHDKNFLDNWSSVEESKVHASPRGRVLHILAGNAPPISLASLLRGALTKNTNILKVSSGDPVTATYLALSFKDVDKTHPITQTTSVVYWEADSPEEQKAFSIANAICVWGGEFAIDAVKKKSNAYQYVLGFGPRRGMQFIGKEVFRDEKFLNECTNKAAYDLVLYDQQACHSPQIAFVEKNGIKFCESLVNSLKIISVSLPKGYVSLQDRAGVSHQRMMSSFFGDKIYQPGSTDWTVVLTKDINKIKKHPLSRTLYVKEVNDLRDAIQYVDPSVQVIAFSSQEQMEELRNELALRGVDRLSRLGEMGYFPLGAPHEGIYPLSHLVRWVSSRDIIEKVPIKVKEISPPEIISKWVRM
jgi:long-chain-fatty-acyl-CoA reductase